MTGPATVYTTSTCAPCKSLKAFLDYKGIPYEAKVIDEDEESMKLVVEMTGQFVMPTTKIGNRWISGYRPTEIMEAVSGEED